jgi:hypothetical protein
MTFTSATVQVGAVLLLTGATVGLMLASLLPTSGRER